MNSLDVPLLKEILTLVAVVGGKTILLTLQVKKLSLHILSKVYTNY